MVTTVGLTGGLAAPLIGAVFGGGGAVFLGTAAGAAVVGSLFGVAGAGLGGKWTVDVQLIPLSSKAMVRAKNFL